MDVGLFGRFVTSDEFDTIDGALQVAHGLGTQKVEVEYDSFTAVDDLSKEAGAGHLGEPEVDGGAQGTPSAGETPRVGPGVVR